MSFEVGDSVRVSDEPYLVDGGGGFVYQGLAGKTGTVVGLEAGNVDVLVEDLEGYPNGLAQWVNPACLTLVEGENDG